MYQAGNSTQDKFLCMTGARIMELDLTGTYSVSPKPTLRAKLSYSTHSWLEFIPHLPAVALVLVLAQPPQDTGRCWDGTGVQQLSHFRGFMSQWWDNKIWSVHQVHKNNMENSSHQLPVELGIHRTWSQEKQMEKDSLSNLLQLLSHPHLLPSRQQEQEVKRGFPSQVITKDWPQWWSVRAEIILIKKQASTELLYRSPGPVQTLMLMLLFKSTTE